jgi:hypothetical protein
MDLRLYIPNYLPLFLLTIFWQRHALGPLGFGQTFILVGITELNKDTRTLLRFDHFPDKLFDLVVFRLR